MPKSTTVCESCRRRLCGLFATAKAARADADEARATLPAPGRWAVKVSGVEDGYSWQLSCGPVRVSPVPRERKHRYYGYARRADLPASVDSAIDGNHIVKPTARAAALWAIGRLRRAVARAQTDLDRVRRVLENFPPGDR